MTFSIALDPELHPLLDCLENRQDRGPGAVPTRVGVNRTNALVDSNGEIEPWEEKLVPTEHSIYDQVPVDSAVERRFVEELESSDTVTTLVYTIPTGDRPRGPGRARPNQ